MGEARFHLADGRGRGKGKNHEEIDLALAHRRYASAFLSSREFSLDPP